LFQNHYSSSRHITCLKGKLSTVLRRSWCAIICRDFRLHNTYVFYIATVHYCSIIVLQTIFRATRYRIIWHFDFPLLMRISEVMWKIHEDTLSSIIWSFTLNIKNEVNLGKRNRNFSIFKNKISLFRVRFIPRVLQSKLNQA